MWELAVAAIIVVMTAPLATSKVLLVEDQRTAPMRPTVVPIRRYRLARLRLDRTTEGPSRYEYLKHTYD